MLATAGRIVGAGAPPTPPHVEGTSEIVARMLEVGSGTGVQAVALIEEADSLPTNVVEAQEGRHEATSCTRDRSGVAPQRSRRVMIVNKHPCVRDPSRSQELKWNPPEGLQTSLETKMYVWIARAIEKMMLVTLKPLNHRNRVVEETRGILERSSKASAEEMIGGRRPGKRRQRGMITAGVIGSVSKT
mmetsp:Transcript_39546/g.157067  ORF Transcript_39546/g.157067 Transcript_39546/m.157067 type:complete len:188 (-) Transcript_39546:1598-2161(-)